MSPSHFLICGISKKPIRSILPARTSLDIVRHALLGSISLLTDEEYRLREQILVIDRIIREEVLVQNGFGNFIQGWTLVLALFHELMDPTLKKHGFKPDEFLEGVKPALDQYYRVRRLVEVKLLDLVTTEKETDENQVSTKVNESSQSKSLADNVLKWDWKDPVVDQLRLMVSPDFFESFQQGSIVRHADMAEELNEFSRHITYKDSVVEDVALLSARSLVIDREENNDINYDNISEDELNPRDADDNYGATVAAQIEVLYSVKHAALLKTPPLGSFTPLSCELTWRFVRVGVWEGYLKGFGENRVLHWKLANIRHSWELPFEDEEITMREA